MKLKFSFAIPLVTFTILLISACTAPTTPMPTSTLPPTESVPTQTPAAVSHDGPVEDYVSLIDNLRAEGATVEPVGEVEQVFFSVKGQSIKVNSADVQVFEYADTSAAETDAALVAPDGGSIGTTMVTWVAVPHFYRTGKIIVLYVGTDPALIGTLEKVMGPQFAGG